MSGVVKGVKKVFKSVVKFVKKAIPYVLMAAAVYFTAGVALSAFAPTAGFAAAMPGFAGGGFAGLGIGQGAVAGTGIFTKAAAAMGLGSLGSSGGLIGGAIAKGATVAQLGAAGINAGAIATGATEAAAAGIGSGMPAAGLSGAMQGTTAAAASGGAGAPAAAGAAGAEGAAAGAGAGAAAPAAAKAGMTIGEKLLLASTGSQALGALLGPGEGSKRFHGSFYGVDRKGKGAQFVPSTEDAPAEGPTDTGKPQESRKMSAILAPEPGQAAKPGELFQQGQSLASATPEGSTFEEDNQDLFRRMPGVRYVQ